MTAYLTMMGVRLVELHRVLKSTGSLYLHCDPTASHYLKILLDAVFGARNFRNEIIWKRSVTKGDARKKFSDDQDTILFYTKHTEYHFANVHTDGDDEYRKRFNHNDNDGRGPYHLAPLDSPNPRPNLMFDYKSYSYPPKGWRISLDEMKKLDADGRVWFPANPRLAALARRPHDFLAGVHVAEQPAVVTTAIQGAVMIGVIPSGIHDPERVLGPALIQGPGDSNKFIVLVVSIRVNRPRPCLSVIVFPAVWAKSLRKQANKGDGFGYLNNVCPIPWR